MPPNFMRVAVLASILLCVTGAVSATENNTGLSEASLATSRLVIGSAINRSTSPEEAELIFQQPEYRAKVWCVAFVLQERGWSMEDHQRLLKITHGTGDIASVTPKEKLAEPWMVKLVVSIESCGDPTPSHTKPKWRH